jgi:hypothetical protein
MRCAMQRSQTIAPPPPQATAIIQPRASTHLHRCRRAPTARAGGAAWGSPVRRHERLGPMWHRITPVYQREDRTKIPKTLSVPRFRLSRLPVLDYPRITNRQHLWSWRQVNCAARCGPPRLGPCMLQADIGHAPQSCCKAGIIQFEASHRASLAGIPHAGGHMRRMPLRPEESPSAPGWRSRWQVSAHFARAALRSRLHLPAPVPMPDNQPITRRTAARQLLALSHYARAAKIPEYAECV